MLQLSGFVDIAFVLLVVGICVRSLIMKSQPNPHGEQWKAELLELEESLRKLIEDASSAGGQLNHNLLLRKSELQSLLDRLEKSEIQKNPEVVVQANVRHSKANDLPNSSWEKPREPRRGDIRKTPIARPTVSGSLQRQIEVSAQELAQLQNDLQQQERGFEDAEADATSDTIEDPSESVARRVARRLLLRGQEIHVVARKVELPLTEVRKIDQSLRQALENGRYRSEQSPSEREEQWELGSVNTESRRSSSEATR